MISEEKPGVVVPATMPEVLLQREESSLEVQKTLLGEKLDKEELAVQGPLPGFGMLPVEIRDDLYPEG